MSPFRFEYFAISSSFVNTASPFKEQKHIDQNKDLWFLRLISFAYKNINLYKHPMLGKLSFFEF